MCSRCLQDSGSNARHFLSSTRDSLLSHSDATQAWPSHINTTIQTWNTRIPDDIQVRAESVWNSTTARLTRLQSWGLSRAHCFGANLSIDIRGTKSCIRWYRRRQQLAAPLACYEITIGAVPLVGGITCPCYSVLFVSGTDFFYTFFSAPQKHFEPQACPNHLRPYISISV